MASLDVLDYQVGLDAALAKRGPDGRPLLDAPLRKQALKDARRTLDAMAFRFAILDERPLPEDLDYLRALEAMKPPERAAEVLARRRPAYQRVRRRRLVTSLVSLGIFALLVAGIVYVATLEEADVLAEFSASESTNATFVVTPEMTRLHVDGTILHAQGEVGNVEIFLYGPDGQTITLWPSGDARNNYLRRNLLPPELTPGEWRVFVDLNGGPGSVYLTITGVRPTR